MLLHHFLLLFHCYAIFLAHSASSQTVSKGGERIKMLFTPTICKVRCTSGRCTNFCENGNVTTLYSNEPDGKPALGPGFRIFLCPMLCQNGGVCIQKDRCQCPRNFTGKFCHIPVTSSTNDIEKLQSSSSLMADQQPLTQTEYLVPLQSQQQPQSNGGSSMVKVRVQHPPEANVKIHQVLKVATGPVASDQQDTVTRSTRVLEVRNSLLGEKMQAPLPQVQAQTLHGVSTYTESSGFKYCFREFHNGRCGSRLPGLRTPKTCCEGTGRAWGINECIPCPSYAGNSTSDDKPCPWGFERIGDTQCMDINECLQPGWCENGNCVNTRGSYNCICRPGYILDASHRICISEKVISEEKGQCYRLLSSNACSLPILRNITKQICCCSRVGKAWGKNCEKCPYYGSDGFKEICPAGPGYHYSPFTIQPNQSLPKHQHPERLIQASPQRHDQSPSESTLTPPRLPEESSNPGILAPQSRLQQSITDILTGQRRTYLWSNGTTTTQSSQVLTSPTQRQTIRQVNRLEISSMRPVPVPVTRRPVHPVPVTRRPVHPVPVTRRPVHPVPVTDRPALLRPGFQGCDINSQICGPGRCVDQPSGRYTCICNPGYLLNIQQTRCYDIDECRRSPSPCANGRCENIPGSFRCLCSTGYVLQGNTCIDINECENDLQCPGQECVNTKGSFRCVACSPGFELKNQQCQDVDECQQTPRSCVNGRCENNPGSYQCLCSRGYKLQGNTCIDEDECQSLRSCGPQGNCINTDGSYRCDCQPGYRAEGPGQQCRDINECFEGDYCFPHGECMNTEGSYLCVCSEGFKSSTNASSCTDVDECARPEACQDGSCVNVQGSFQCQCNVGFITNPEKTACLDKDECADSGGAICWPKRCENTIGSYYCVTICEPGYVVSLFGECVDINECVNETICGEHSFCQNLIGTYQCMCNQGYKVMENGKGCEDENECDTILGVCGTAHCVNMDGSFFCECPGEDEEFDLRMRRCLSRPQPGQLVFPNGSSYSLSSSLWSPQPQVPVVSAGISLPVSLPGELRECYYNTQDQSSCHVLARNSTHQECCCTIGEGWGHDCQYSPCPSPASVEYQALCPSRQGYVTSESGVYSYRDVDECKLFDPEICKKGVCVNNIPGYSCYCPSGYYYDALLLECTDNNECEGEVVCSDGICVNTMGSFYCSCEPPLVLDDTQRSCVNITHLIVDENLSFCWQRVTEDLICQDPLLSQQVTFSECCCLYGEAWGLHCAFCPTEDSDEYEMLCNILRPPVFYSPLRRSYGPGPDSGLRRSEDYSTPYDSFSETSAPRSDFSSPGYNLYTSQRGRTSGFRGRSPGPQETPYNRQAYVSLGPEPRPFLQMSDIVSEPVYEPRPRPQSRGRARSVAARRESSRYRDDVNRDDNTDENEPVESRMRFVPEEARSIPEYPRQPSSSRIFERRYEPYQSLGSDDCGSWHDCRNGRCIRIPEGYTCDCYDGYHLDIASLACIDIDECEETGDPTRLCVNGQCVNTDGSYRCMCNEGYVMFHEPNLCIPSRSQP